MKAAKTLLFAVLLLTSCTKQDVDVPDIPYYPDEKDAGLSMTVEETLQKVHKPVAGKIPRVEFYFRAVDPESKGGTYRIEAVSDDNLIDLNFDIMSIYAFGNKDVSGDYYGIKGYAVVHNGSAFKHEQLSSIGERASTVDKQGWYTGNLGLNFQLLDKNGNPVSSDNVEFFSNPQPTTTIGSTTYSTGFTFNFSVGLTLGATKFDEDEQKNPSLVALGFATFGFDWNNKSTQYLPDQSVEMTTGSDRSVSYKFVTNNDKSSIPPLFRTDQRVEFDWVWHVKSGAYSAKDRCMEGMKLKVLVSDEFRAKLKDTHNEVIVSPENPRQSMEPVSLEIDIPGINRIPIGTVNFKNTARSYVNKVKIWRSEGHDTQKPYCEIPRAFGKGGSFDQVLREGKYDLYFDLVDGDSGRAKGHYVIRNITITDDATVYVSTMDAERI